MFNAAKMLLIGHWCWKWQLAHITLGSQELADGFVVVRLVVFGPTLCENELAKLAKRCGLTLPIGGFLQLLCKQILFTSLDAAQGHNATFERVFQPTQAGGVALGGQVSLVGLKWV